MTFDSHLNTSGTVRACIAPVCDFKNEVEVVKLPLIFLC